MAENQQGGYRRPNNPAPVSGPGALSARTDGGPTSAPAMKGDGSYGDSADMAAIQSAAAMRPSRGASPRAALPGLSDPTARPDEPLTQGADAGMGLSASAAGISTDAEVSDAQVRPLLRSLEVLANLPGSNAETRTLVRNLKARLSNG